MTEQSKRETPIITTKPELETNKSVNDLPTSKFIQIIILSLNIGYKSIKKIDVDSENFDKLIEKIIPEIAYFNEEDTEKMVFKIFLDRLRESSHPLCSIITGIYNRIIFDSDNISSVVIDWLIKVLTIMLDDMNGSFPPIPYKELRLSGCYGDNQARTQMRSNMKNNPYYQNYQKYFGTYKPYYNSSYDTEAEDYMTEYVEKTNNSYKFNRCDYY